MRNRYMIGDLVRTTVEGELEGIKTSQEMTLYVVGIVVIDVDSEFGSTPQIQYSLAIEDPDYKGGNVVLTRPEENIFKIGENND